MRNFSPTNNFNENIYLNNIKNEVESPKINSIRRRFMNFKNKYNNFTPDIEIRNKNNQLIKDDKINAYIDNYNNYNSNINRKVEKYKGMKSFEKIKKEEPFKINLSRINNKENEEIKIHNNTNININTEEEILINKNFLNTEKKILRAYYSPNKERINIVPYKDKKNKSEKEEKTKENEINNK